MDKNIISKGIFYKYKKMLIIVLLIMNCFVMTSCFSYKDIDKVLFVTALIIDADITGNPIIYAEAFMGIRGATPEGTDVRILFKGEGKTLFEAIRDMNGSSTYKLDYSQNKVTIFTIRAAEFGVDNFIDLLDRDQEVLIRPYIAVYLGDPEKLISIEIPQEKYIGLYVELLIENIGASSRAVKLTLNEYYNQRTMGDKTSVVTIIDIKKDSLEPKLQINGGAVIKEDKMINMLSRDEGQGYNFLMNSVDGGTLEITNPDDINKFVTLEILKSKTNTQIYYYDNIVHLKKKIKVNVNFGEAQKSIMLTKENMLKIEEKSEGNIVKACTEIFQTYKDMGVDIFDISEKFYEKYPKVDIKDKDIITKTVIDVEVEVEIMNIGTVKNFD